MTPTPPTPPTVSPTGEALFTISPTLGYVGAVIGVLTGTTLPALIAAGIAVPVWVPIVVGSVQSLLLVVALLGPGARKKAK